MGGWKEEEEEEEEEEEGRVLGLGLIAIRFMLICKGENGWVGGWVGKERKGSERWVVGGRDACRSLLSLLLLLSSFFALLSSTSLCSSCVSVGVV